MEKGFPESNRRRGEEEEADEIEQINMEERNVIQKASKDDMGRPIFTEQSVTDACKFLGNYLDAVNEEGTVLGASARMPIEVIRLQEKIRGISVGDDEYNGNGMRIRSIEANARKEILDNRYIRDDFPTKGGKTQMKNMRKYHEDEQDKNEDQGKIDKIMDRNLGCIPKTKKQARVDRNENVEMDKCDGKIGGTEKARKEKVISDGSSSSGTDPDDMESSDGEGSVSIGGRQANRERRKRTRGVGQNMEFFEKMLERLDNRRMPQLEGYDGDRDELEEYLIKFEDYCEENIRGNHSFWIKELEKLLTGDILAAFLSFRDKKDTYKSLKAKLIEWNKDTKEHRKTKAREKFNKLKMKKNEDLYIYSNRLEAQLKVAFPKMSESKIQLCNVLQQKFLETVPKSFRNLIEGKKLAMKVEGEKIKWKLIQKYARFTDVESLGGKKSEETDDEQEEELREIMINVQDSGRVQNNNTQNYERSNNLSFRRSNNRNNQKPNNQDYQRSNNQDYQRSNNQDYQRSRDQNYQRTNNQNHQRSNNQDYQRHDPNQYYPGNQNSQRPRNDNREMPSNRGYQRSNDQDYQRSKYYDQQRPNHQVHQKIDDQRTPQNYGRSMTFDSVNKTQHYNDNIPEGKIDQNKTERHGMINGTSQTKCNYCGKLGHLVDACRSRLGLCIICGKSNHTMSACRFNWGNQREAQRTQMNDQDNHQQINEGSKFRQEKENNNYKKSNF